MINSFCDTLRSEVKEAIELRRNSLERGAGDFAADERVRGEIWGLRQAIEEINALEEKARRQDDDAS